MPSVFPPDTRHPLGSILAQQWVNSHIVVWSRGWYFHLCDTNWN